MATADEMRALLSVACSWCGAKPGQRCVVRMGKKRIRHVPSTLDGESHDARWQRALGHEAPVLYAQAERVTGREPVPVGSVLGERPW